MVSVHEMVHNQLDRITSKDLRRSATSSVLLLQKLLLHALQGANNELQRDGDGAARGRCIHFKASHR